MESLLNTMRKAGAQEQVTALLARDPAAHVTIDDPHAAGALLALLRRAGAQAQVIALTERLPAAGAFSHFLTVGDHRVRFRFGRERDGAACPMGVGGPGIGNGADR